MHQTLPKLILASFQRQASLKPAKNCVWRCLAASSILRVWVHQIWALRKDIKSLWQRPRQMLCLWFHRFSSPVISSSSAITQSKRTRGLVIALLVFAILNLPLPFWNCFYAFSSTDIYGFDNTSYSSSSWAHRYNTIAVLGLAFGLVTLAHGLFGLVKITIFSIDIDHKLPTRVRSKFAGACLSEW